MKRKVLILCNCASGLYDFRGMLIRSFIQNNYEVLAVVPVDEEPVELAAEKKLQDLGCILQRMPIDRRGINPIKDIGLFLRYIKCLVGNKIDLVLTYTIKCNLYGGIGCRILRIPYAINITGLGTAFQGGGILRKIVTMLYKIACKKAKVVFFENEANKQLFIDERIVDVTRAYRLYGAGVDLERFMFKEYPKASEPIRFLFVGRIMKEKGVDEYFQAARYIIRKYPNTEFHVVGNYEDDYQDVITQLEKENIIHFHGYQEDVRPFIESCAAFVLPSYHEGMANTLLEAGAMGRPLITSNIPGCKEAVVDGQTGLLFQSKSQDALICSLEKFMSYTYEERRIMGMTQYQYIEKWFDKRKVVQETINEVIE